MKANIDIKMATQEVMKHPEIQKKTFSEALADKLKDFKLRFHEPLVCYIY